jgi:hypothetical protein
MKFANQIKERDLDLDIITIEMIPNINEPRRDSVSFELSKDNVTNGKFDITLNEKKIDIDIDATFEVSVKNDYVDDVKSNKMIWWFGDVEGIYGDVEDFSIEGLKEHVHKYFNQRLEEDVEDKYYHLDVKCL